MIRRAALGLMFGLAACGTPLERCINAATHDLRIVDRLIGEARVNIARGYAMEEVVVRRGRWVLCAPPPPAPDSTSPQTAPVMCFESVPETVLRPKAIDLDEEARKLASLERKRVDLARQAEPAIALCRAQYPE